MKVRQLERTGEVYIRIEKISDVYNIIEDRRETPCLIPMRTPETRGLIHCRDAAVKIGNLRLDGHHILGGP